MTPVRKRPLGKRAHGDEHSGATDSGPGRRARQGIGRGRAGSYRSGQTGQTVNLMAYAFAGSNPALPNEGKAEQEKAESGVNYYERCGG
jgi:hypothetical protein